MVRTMSMSTAQPMKHKGAQRPDRRMTGRRASTTQDAGSVTPRHAAASGQTLVEFALVLVVFLLMTLGLLDGLRVIFYYSQVQEAARTGARWGAVEVARDVNGATLWGTFGDQGNAAATYCDAGCGAHTITGHRKLADGVTDTILGATARPMTAANLSQATVTISTPISSTATEALQTDDQLTNNPVTVTVTYPFKPILGLVFGGVTITLKGSSAMLHE